MAMYHNEIYVFDEERPIRAVVRNYQEEDFPGLIRIQQESFPPPFPEDLIPGGSIMYRDRWGVGRFDDRTHRRIRC